MYNIKNYYNFNAAGGSTVINDKVLKKMISMNIGVNINGDSKLALTGQTLIKDFKLYLYKLLNTNEHKYTILLTSSASESNNLTFRGIADYYNYKNITPIFSINSIEHETSRSCVNLLCNLKRIKLNLIPVNHKGEIIHTHLDKKSHLVSIMSVNNETGAINDIHKIYNYFKNSNTIIHSDISQSFGKESFDLNKTGIHLLTICPHKILSAPTSIGLLIMRNDIKDKIICQISGNNIFNLGFRGATLNPILIAGAFEAFKENFTNRIQKNIYINNIKNYFLQQLNNYFNVYFYENIQNNIEDLKKPYFLIISPKKNYYHIILLSIILDNNCNTKFKHFLENNKILCSVASVCQTSSAKSSFVLNEIGIKETDIKKGILRFSFNEQNNKGQINYLINVLKKLIQINFLHYIIKK